MSDTLENAFLPQDWRDATLIGRIETAAGPTPILVKDGVVYDMSGVAPTVSQLLKAWPEQGVPSGGIKLGALEDFQFGKTWPENGKPVERKGCLLYTSPSPRD